MSTNEIIVVPQPSARQRPLALSADIAHVALGLLSLLLLLGATVPGLTDQLVESMTWVSHAD